MAQGAGLLKRNIRRASHPTAEQFCLLGLDFHSQAVVHRN